MKTMNTIWLLVVCSCAPTIRVYSEQPEAAPLVHQAGDLLGVRTRMMEAPGPGITTLEIRGTEFDPETGQQICGQALERVLHADSIRDALTGGVVECEPKAWSCATVTYVTHELGHIYGLPHADQTDDFSEAGKVMQPNPGRSMQVTKRERTIVHIHALGLQEICRATP